MLCSELTVNDLLTLLRHGDVVRIMTTSSQRGTATHEADVTRVVVMSLCVVSWCSPHSCEAAVRILMEIQMCLTTSDSVTHRSH